VAGGRSAGGGVRPLPSVDVLNLSSVRRERVSATTGAVSAVSPAADPERVVALRGALRARVQTTYDVVDNLGHVRQPDRLRPRRRLGVGRAHRRAHGERVGASGHLSPRGVVSVPPRVVSVPPGGGVRPLRKCLVV